MKLQILRFQSINIFKLLNNLNSSTKHNNLKTR